MELPLHLGNLVAASLQIAVLAAAGSLLAVILRLRLPSVAHRYWQSLLLACLLLPALEPRCRPAAPSEERTAVLLRRGPVDTAAAPGLAPARTAHRGVTLVLAGGVALRLAWLAIGFVRLGILRRGARRISQPPPGVRAVQERLGVRADIFVSAEVSGPVTFGAWRPVILVPRNFVAMRELWQQAIACHELLHARRRDWAFIVVEELVRSLWWFHPAVWWLVTRIRVSREQEIDRQVVILLGCRTAYLEALLEMAQARARAQAMPAPLFLHERHLVERVALLTREVSMTRPRILASLATAALALLWTGRLAAGWFPLSAPPSSAAAFPAQASSAPQVSEPSVRVGANVQESRLIERVDPVYPEEAKRARVSGPVILQVTIDPEGRVSSAKVLKGHPLLDDAAASAVRQWRYAPTSLNGRPVSVIATVSIVFRLQAELALVMDEAGNLSEPALGLYGLALDARIAQARDLVQLEIRDAPPWVAEAALAGLRTRTAADIAVTGCFALYRGRLFYTSGEYDPPQLVLDMEELTRLAELPRPGVVVPPGVAGLQRLVYAVYVTEAGEIAGLEIVRGRRVAAVEAELLRARVIAPGFRGADAVAAVAVVEIPYRPHGRQVDARAIP